MPLKNYWACPDNLANLKMEAETRRRVGVNNSVGEDVDNLVANDSLARSETPDSETTDEESGNQLIGNGKGLDVDSKPLPWKARYCTERLAF